MDIEISKKSGFCFGVSSIDKKASEAIKNRNDSKEKLYSYGPLVHNPQYVAKMESEGIQVLHTIEDCKKLDSNSTIILRAHGVPVEERKMIESTGAKIIDGTCPVLLHIYQQGRKKNEEGYQIIIIGDPNHAEIIAMKSFFNEDTLVISTKEEAEQLRSDKKLYVISQTTNRKEYFDELSNILSKNNDIEIKNTICNATKERQEYAIELSKNVDCMIVIGGRNSSNTEKLAKVVSKNCKEVQKIEVFSDLTLQNISKFNKIGITAGASTPAWIIEEVVEGMDNFTNEEFMEQVNGSMIKIYPKDIVKGSVISVKDDEIFVDIRFRSDGIIKTDEMTDYERENTREAFHEGDEIDVYVIKLDDGEGNVVLSTRRVEGLKSWQKLVDEYEADAIVEAKVTGENAGGLVVNVMGINGFIPASQITTYFVKNFKQFVGETLECKIISVDEKKRRVVLSSRAVKEEKLDRIWEKIVVGEKVQGKIVRMTDFGAFVDLGGVDGLIHVSDVSWERIEKPSEVLEVGQEVEPVVLKANRERNRISLGLKQLMPKPFELFVENNKVGDVVKGKVINLLDFGAFVRLPEGVEGLVHVSQISNERIEKPSDVLNIGQEVEVKILEIDQERQRIALSMRALLEPVKTEEDTKTEAKPERAAQNRAKFERKPKKERTQRPRREKEKLTLNFDNDSEMGTNLGDLISAKFDLLDLDLTSEESQEENE